LIEKNRLTG